MNETPVQITEQPGAATVPPALAPLPATPSIRRAPRGWLYKTLHAVASLRVTVVLFALSIFLVFAGTLAQRDANIWTVVARYFRSFFVWIPLQVFNLGNSKTTWPGTIPFPGGWLLGSLLLGNLLAAHAIRFKLSWKRSGIILLHAGLIVIMLGELVTGLKAVEGSMVIYQGQSSNYVMHPRESELAVSLAGTGNKADFVVVPMALLRDTGTTISNPELPFDVEVVRYMVNCRVCKHPDAKPEFISLQYGDLPDTPQGTDNPATAGLGVKDYVAVNQPETSGVDQSKEDQAGAYLRFKQKGTGKDLGTYMFSVLLQEEPQYVTVDGKKYDVRLRLKRSYKPYTMHLIEFRHDKYMGTEKPKNFSSRVRLTDPENNEDREVIISMNSPLRYGGETFYQQSFLQGDRATILQVVHNPAWLFPYISCVMVALGMLIHFGINLQNFLQRRAAS